MILREATYDTLNLKLVSNLDCIPIENDDILYICASLEVHCGDIPCERCPFDKSPGCSSGDISIDQICELFDISAENHPEYFI